MAKVVERERDYIEILICNYRYKYYSNDHVVLDLL